MSSQMHTVNVLVHSLLVILHRKPLLLSDVFSYRFPCSIGSNKHSQRIEERDYLFVFILNPKAPHPQDAHLVYL